MPKKFLLSLIAVFLVTPLFLQLTTVKVSANHDPAMTSPVTFFNVIGRVTYKQLGRLVGNAQRFVGVDDVTITAVGFFDKSQRYTTTTDENGVYSFNIPAGLYSFELEKNSSLRTNFFVPPYKTARVNTHRAQRVDFQGLLFPNL